MSGAAQLPSSERQWRAATTLGWPLALGAAPLLVSLNNVQLCAFRQLTGAPCPLCGGTHACAALVEGNLSAAWQASPAVMVLLAVALAHTVQLAYEAWCGRMVAPPWRMGARLWAGTGMAMLVLWAMRLTGLV